jgi:hypothetical protein
MVTPNFDNMVQPIISGYKNCRYYSAHDKKQLEFSLVCLKLADVTDTKGNTFTAPLKVQVQKDILRWFFAL